MPWVTPKTWVAGAVLPASDLNTHLRDQLLELRGGGISIPSQAVDDFLFAEDTDQIGRVAAASGWPFYDGTQWVIKRDLRYPVSIAAGVLTLDFALGAKDWFEVTLNADITTMTLQNLPSGGRAFSFALDVIADGTPRDWPWFETTVEWPSNLAPVPTSTAGKMDRYIFAYDGTTWTGSVSGQVYP